MKRILLLLGLAFYTGILFAKAGAHSVEDFEKLYESKILPFDKISDTTFVRLKNGISFDAEGRFRGFLFIGGLRKELTYKEYLKFNELISGEKMAYDKEEEKEYNRRRSLP